MTLLAFATLVPRGAAAQADAVRVHAGASFGLGGEISTEMDDESFGDIPDYDLITTLGGGAGVEIPLHSLFTVGVGLDVARWNSEARADPPRGMPRFDRHTQLDALVRPKLRFTLARQLELYGVLPMGFTYFVPSDDSELDFGAYKTGVEGGPGFAAGVGAGAALFLHEHVGVTAEVGYLYRHFKATVYRRHSAGDDEWEQTLRFGQVQLRVGIAVAF